MICRKITELLFTNDELACGNATEARTTCVTLMDSNKLYAITCYILLLTYKIAQQKLFILPSGEHVPLSLPPVHCLYRFPKEGDKI